MTEIDTESDYNESDEELQEALITGKLKPGLNIVEEKSEKVFTNNVTGMKEKLNEIKLNLPWIETLVLANTEAPLAPELAAQMHEQELKRANQLKNNAKLPQYKPSDDPVLNDFKRELIFHRQAQAAVLDGIPRLKQLDLATKRPVDYFAEMAKTDEHMHKVREGLMRRQVGAQRSERVKQLRLQKKEGKAIQAQVRLQKQKEKKEMLNQIKRVRKGLSNNLDTPENTNNSDKKNRVKKSGKNKKSMERRKVRDEKFGFGGRKKGMKRNTKDSAGDVSSYRKPGKPAKGAKVRPGKNRRQNMKGKSKGRK